MKPKCSSGMTSNTLRESKNSMKVLRRFRVLHRAFNHCFQSYFFPVHKSLVIAISTCAVYGVIRLTGPRAIVMGFVSLLALIYSIPALFQIEMFLKGEDIPKFVFQYLKFFSHVHETYADKSKPKNLVKVNKFMTTMFVIGILINFENSSLILKKPYKPQFFTSIFANPSQVPIFYRMPLIILQMWVWINTWVSICHFGSVPTT
ncbi:unnamed protein product [Orchesella dallaii]|uniref:ADP,ATP carrier protein n=1 Tax=Orchesella dallaii TaxID=48710 RepID=A0ABP1PQ72_9HEXA